MSLQTLSESVYLGLCHKIGTPQEVTIRRDVWDVRELLDRKKTEYTHWISMLSGSQREGFRFMDSDVDTMEWFDHYRVLWDLGYVIQHTQIQAYSL